MKQLHSKEALDTDTKQKLLLEIFMQQLITQLFLFLLHLTEF